MQFSSLLVAIFAISVARCAPAPNSTVFTDNARQAQQFNAKFLNLNATDACQADETACVGANIAKCVAGKFVTSEQCPDGRECFAIPNIQTPGTSLVCSTEVNVLGLLSAAGVDGGITGDNSTNTDSTSSCTSSTTTSSSTSSTTGLSGIPNPANGKPGNPAVVTVTVTEFAIPQSTTTTLSLSGSSSTPSNLLSVGQPPATSTPGAPPLTPAANPSSTSSSASVPSVISLVAGADDASNPSPSPTPTSFPVAIQLSAAAGEPTPSPTPSPSGPVAVPVAGGGGGGYY